MPTTGSQQAFNKGLVEPYQGAGGGQTPSEVYNNEGANPYWEQGGNQGGGQPPSGGQPAPPKEAAPTPSQPTPTPPDQGGKTSIPVNQWGGGWYWNANVAGGGIWMPTDMGSGAMTEASKTNKQTYFHPDAGEIKAGAVVQAVKVAPQILPAQLNNPQVQYAIKNISLQYQIPEREAQRLVILMFNNPNAAEFKTLSESQRNALASATKGGSAWDVAQQAVVEGRPVWVDTDNGFRLTVLAMSPKEQEAKFKSQTEASQLLTSKGIITDIGNIDISKINIKDPQIKQALYDISPKFNQEAINTMLPALAEAYNKGGYVGYVREANKYDEQISQLKATATNTINEAIATSGIKVIDTKHLTLPEIQALIIAGVIPQLLVYAGQDESLVNQAVESINAKVTEWKQAQDKLASAGFIKAQYPQGGAPFELYTTEGMKTSTIGNLALWQQEHPEDTTTIKTYYNQELADIVNKQVQNTQKGIDIIDDKLSAKVTPPGILARIPGVGEPAPSGQDLTNIGNAMMDVGIMSRSKALLNLFTTRGNDAVIEIWNSLPYADKAKVAEAYTNSFTKESIFAGVNKKVMSIIGTDWKAQLPFGMVSPITNVAAKQLSIPEAKALLGKEYASELSAIKEFIKPNGIVDILGLELALDSDSQLAKNIKDLGYTDFKDLKTNLEYYNINIRVTNGEWATAGAVAALNALILASGPLAGLGVVGKFIQVGILGGAGSIFLPNTIQTIKSPDVSMPEKVLAGGVELMLFTGAGLSLKPIPVLKGKAQALIGAEKIIGKEAKEAVAQPIKEAGIPKLKPLPIDISARISASSYDAGYKLGETIKNAYTLPDKTVNALMDAAGKVDEAIAQATKAYNTTRVYFTDGLPDFTVNRLMDAAGVIDNSIALAHKAILEAKAFITDGLPDKAINVLMDAARAIDYATGKAKEAILSTKQFITEGLPDATVNTLMDTAGDVDDAIGRATKTAITVRGFITEGLPDATINALMDAADSIDKATVKANEAIKQSREFVTDKIPDRAVDVLMEAARQIDNATVKAEKVLAASRAFVTVAIPDVAVNSIMDAAGKVDEAVAKANQVAKTTRVYVSETLPDKAVNALMVIADDVDKATTKAIEAKRLAVRYATEGLPDKAVDVLMNAAKDIDDAMARAKQAVAVVRRYATETIADNTVNALMDAAGKVDNSIDKASKVYQDVKNLALEKLPNETVNALMDAAGQLDKALDTARATMVTSHKFVTEKMPDMAVDALMQSAEVVDMATARAMEAYKNAKGIVTEKIPDVTINALMDAAGKVDQATAKATQALADARKFVSDGLPDKAVEVLMDTAKAIDDATASANNAMKSARGLLTDKIPDATVNALMDAAGKLDDATAKANKVLADTKQFINNVPDTMVNVLMDTAEKVDYTTALTKALAEGTKTYLTRDLPDNISNALRERWFRLQDEVVAYAEQVTGGMQDAKLGKPKAESWVRVLQEQREARIVTTTAQLNLAGKLGDTALTPEQKSALAEYIKGLNEQLQKDKTNQYQTNIDKNLRQIKDINKIPTKPSVTLSDADWNKFIIRDVFETGEVGEVGKGRLEPIRESLEARLATTLQQQRRSGLIQNIPSYVRDRIVRELEIKPLREQALRDLQETLEDRYGAENLDHYLKTGEWLEQKELPLTLGEDAQLKGIDKAGQISDKINELLKNKDDLKEQLSTKAKTEVDEVIEEAEKILKETDNEGLRKTLNDLDEFLKEQKQKEAPPEPLPEKGGGSRVAVKEKTEVKPETKTKTAEELEKELYAEKVKPKEETKPKAGVKVKEEVKPEEKATPSTKESVFPGIGVKVEEGLRTEPALASGVSPYIITETGIKVVTTPFAAPEPIITPSPSVTPVPEPSPVPSPTPEPTPVPVPTPEPSPAPAPAPAPSPAPTPSPMPTPAPVPSPAPSPAPQPQPQPVPTPVPEPTPKKPPIPLVIQSQIPDAWKKTGIPPGTLTWRQGIKFAALPPPYRDEDKLWLDHPLPGTKKFAVGKGSARATLQVLGGVPPNDADINMGWANVHISSKTGKLEMNFTGGKEAADTRWALEQEMMDELERESYQGLPVGTTEVSRIPRVRMPISAQALADVGEVYPPQDMTGLGKVELPQYQAGQVKVYMVNGQYIRNEMSKTTPEAIDFTQGGHSQVYDWIPQNEIWIDKANTPEDKIATILHELREYRAMSGGMEYDTAHETVANPLEREARHNPSEMTDMILDEIANYSPRREASKVRNGNMVYVPSYYRRKTGNEPNETEESAIRLPVKSYLGRKLRPTPVLGAGV